MKTLLLAFGILVSSTTTFAQSITFGVKGGLNISSPASDENIPDFNFKHQSLTGFNAGAIVDINFHHFTLRSGVFFTTKGDKIPQQQMAIPNSSTAYIVPNSVARFDYIEESVNGLYNIPVSPWAIVELGGGPYLGEETSGRYSQPGTASSMAIRLKSPDYGFNVVGGLKIKKKILADVGYSFGLRNIASNGTSLKNRVLSFSVGYLLF